MFTRGFVTHSYFPKTIYPVSQPGAVKSMVHNNIVQTWAIARPVAAPSPNGAPFYVNGYAVNELQRGGTQAVIPYRPREMMDPSNPRTWQREYRFTN